VCRVDQPFHQRHHQEELDLLRRHMDRQGVPVVMARHWAEGSAGAEELARVVVGLAESGTAHMRLVYQDEDSLWDKMKAIATKHLWRVGHLGRFGSVRAKIAQTAAGWLRPLPGVCGQDAVFVLDRPQAAGAPSGHMVNIREVRLAAGAEFVVMICGDIMTMPGLPREPASSSDRHRRRREDFGAVVWQAQQRFKAAPMHVQPAPLAA
jgi:formate--tetrahydrofolate ligase